MKILTSLVILMFGISGCSSYHPLPIAFPNNSDYIKYKDTSEKSIPFPKNLADSKKYTWTFAEHYRHNKNKLLKKIYNHGDDGFFGTLLAMVSGAAKSPEGIVVGAAIAAGSEIAPARYQLAMQAANYESAEKGVMCVFDDLMKLTPEEESNLAAFEYVIGTQKENTTPDLILITMKQIHARLESAQSKVVLLSPSLDKLQQALDSTKNSRNASVETGQAADKVISSEKNALVSKAVAEGKSASEAASAVAAIADPMIKINDTLSIPSSKLKIMASEGDKKLQELKAKLNVCTQLVSSGT